MKEKKNLGTHKTIPNKRMTITQRFYDESVLGIENA
jgi:hypothetical protein